MLPLGRAWAAICLPALAIVFLSHRAARAQEADGGVADAGYVTRIHSLDSGIAPNAVTPATVSASARPAAIDVTVRGNSRAQRTRESAEAVTVVELDTAKRQAADLGEVLARNEGIGLRRMGGLGSAARFSLNGLTDDQIRFFLDDVPLELAGFVQGVANLPWLQLEHVVVYRGVVPIRFGADALGGAVNLITRQPVRGWGGEASYQIGSFGTHRATLSAFQVHRPTGIYSRLSLYLDETKNDYEITARVASDDGPFSYRRVKRFHDDYRAFGGAAELGVVKKPWAERLVLRVFAMKLASELQTNLIQSASYGEATFDRASLGSTLRYQQPLARNVRLEAVAGYSYSPTQFNDDSRWIYDWLGERVRPDNMPGETSNKAIVQRIWQHATFARALAAWTVAPGHKLELAIMPTHVFRTGKDELRKEGRDPLADEQQLLSVVTGLAYQLSLFDRVDNSLFAKSYIYRTRANQTAPNGVQLARDSSITRFGVGDSVRVWLTRSLYAKGSYELATRLPRPEEVFGDGVLIKPSLTIKEESSHNGNLELSLRHDTQRAGQLRASVNGFLRKVHNQIVLIPVTERDMRYENVYAARARGVEAAAGWTSPREYVSADANAMYLDLRNTSSKGTFGRYEGDRLPNRPYLYANGSLRGMLQSLLRTDDQLSLTWYLRYVHGFYRFWGSDGLAETKLTVPKQTTHALVLMYSMLLDDWGLDASLECQNLTDAQVFDNFGAQRPGRSYWFKLSGHR